MEQRNDLFPPNYELYCPNHEYSTNDFNHKGIVESMFRNNIPLQKLRFREAVE